MTDVPTEVLTGLAEDILKRAGVDVPTPAAEIAVSLIGIVVKMVGAGGTDAAQEEALMSAQEEAKRLLDKRKFG